jgi:hypothetical protein
MPNDSSRMSLYVMKRTKFDEYCQLAGLHAYLAQPISQNSNQRTVLRAVTQEEQRRVSYLLLQLSTAVTQRICCM